MNNFSGACPKCGEAIEKSSTKFCRGCGTSVERFIEFDNPAHLRSYEEAAFALLSDGDTSVDDPRLEHLRSRLLISQSYRQSILANLHKQIQSVKPLSNFRVEFDSNVQDALVNGDTLLRFRFTNLSDSEQLKLEICWDDPELPEDQDFKVFTRGFCKPRNNESLIQTHVFRRPGRKSITGILAHITNLYGDKATFNLSPIEFFVASPNQTLVQHTTTNTSISIEGRGVIDASGVAANAAGTHDPALKSHWVALQHTHKYESLLNKTPAQEDLEELAATLTNHQATKGDQNEKVVVNTNSVKAIEVDKEIVTVGLNGVTPTDLEPRSPLGQSLTKEIREGDRRNSEDELTRPPRLRENIEQLFDSFVALDVSEGGAERRVLLASSWSLT